jgi:hypothetical protein
MTSNDHTCFRSTPRRPIDVSITEGGIVLPVIP